MCFIILGADNIQQYTTKESSLIITVFVWPNLFPLVFRGPAGFFFRKMATDSRSLSPLKLQNWPSMCSWTCIGKTWFHPMLSSTHKKPLIWISNTSQSQNKILDMKSFVGFPKNSHILLDTCFVRRRPWQRVVKYKASNLRSHLGSYLARVG